MAAGGRLRPGKRKPSASNRNHIAVLSQARYSACSHDLHDVCWPYGTDSASAVRRSSLEIAGFSGGLTNLNHLALVELLYKQYGFPVSVFIQNPPATVDSG